MYSTPGLVDWEFQIRGGGEQKNMREQKKKKWNQ